MIETNYDSIESFMEKNTLVGTDNIFKNISKLNKDIDKMFHEIIQKVKRIDVPESEKTEKINALANVYKGLIKFYVEQNEGYAEMYQETGMQTKAAKKAQNDINKLAMKYMNEMTGLINEAK